MLIWFWHPHRRAPPAPAHIRALDLHIRYYSHRRRHTVSTATLTWTPPSTRTDGSPLAPSDIAGTKVFDGTNEIGTVDGAGGSFTTGELTPGEHSFTVVVHDKADAVSAPSNAAVISAAAAPPAAVTDLAAALNA